MPLKTRGAILSGVYAIRRVQGELMSKRTITVIAAVGGFILVLSLAVGRPLPFTFGPLPGEMWGVHEFSTDQLGNLYTAEVFNGRPQKFRPKPNADKDKLVGEQMRVAWKD